MSVDGPAEQVLLFSYPTVPSREQTAVDVGEVYPASAMPVRLPGGEPRNGYSLKLPRRPVRAAAGGQEMAALSLFGALDAPPAGGPERLRHRTMRDQRPNPVREPASCRAESGSWSGTRVEPAGEGSGLGGGGGCAATPIRFPAGAHAPSRLHGRLLSRAVDPATESGEPARSPRAN